MKFNTAWAKTAAQNVTLKIATVTLAIVAIGELILIGSLISQDLTVIERGCFSRALQAKPINPSKSEIEAFLIEALSMRFDSSGYLKEGFLSIEESILREKEQATLTQRQITQKIIINEIQNEGKEITVLVDRILSVGKIKSVLPLNIKANVQKSNRTDSNPYGLVLNSISPIEEKEEK